MYTLKNIISPYDINQLIKVPSIAHIIPYEIWDSIPHQTIDLLRDIRENVIRILNKMDGMSRKNLDLREFYGNYLSQDLSDILYR